MSTLRQTDDGFEKDNVSIARHEHDSDKLVIQTSSHVILDSDDLNALVAFLAQ